MRVRSCPARDLALLTRALAVNASRWPEAARARYRDECRRLGRYRHFQAKEEVARQFGHGVLDADLMREAPGFGTTLVGVGTVRKDGAQVFEVPLPTSMSGDSVHRAMYVTLAWFSPVEASRARYRLAALEAVASDGGELGEDDEEERVASGDEERPPGCQDDQAGNSLVAAYGSRSRPGAGVRRGGVPADTGPVP